MAHVSRLSQQLAKCSAVVFMFLFASAGAAHAAGPPIIKATSFSQVTTTSATLQAEINPNAKATKYHFEYGLADCASNPCTTVPAGTEPQIPGSNPATLVSAPITGLAPGTIYHFQVIVKNSEIEIPLSGPDTAFTTYTSEHSFGACPNETFRSGGLSPPDHPSSRLPDCRAYEQASSPEKNGTDIFGASNKVQASTDGNSIAFFTAAGLPGAIGAQDFQTYLASRGESAWSTSGVYPPASDGPVALNAGWNPDLSFFFSVASDSFNGERTFRMRSSADGLFTTIASGPSAVRNSTMVGVDGDGSLVYFQNETQLVPEASPGNDNLYVWDLDTDTVRLAGVLPASACPSSPCIPASGAFAGSYEWFFSKLKGFESRGNRESYIQAQHAISSDGSKAYFTSDAQLYLRRNAAGPNPTTIHVSAPQRSEADPLGTRPAAFMAATPDGEHAFFTSAEKLTDDANTGPEPDAVPTIGRAGIDGTGADLDFLPTYAKGLTVSGEYIYWADPVNDAIGRAKLNGSGKASEEDPDFITGADNPQAIAVADGYIYWTNAAGEEKNEGSIGRATLVGEGVEDIRQAFVSTTFSKVETWSPPAFTLTFFNPRGIAVDGSHIYWGDVGEDSYSTSLMRSDLAGGEVEAYGEDDAPGVFRPSHFAPESLAIQGNYIYFSSRAGVDYSNFYRQSLVDARDNELLGNEIGGIGDLVTDGFHFFWTNTTNNSIGRANLELGERKADFVTGTGNPQGLATDGSRLYWSANQEIPANSGNDLYRFDAATGDLSDLTVDNTNPSGAEVLGILGVSEDGSSIYYVANGVPDGTINSPNGRGESAELGNCHGYGTPNDLVFSGECNLYLRDGGQTIFITQLAASSDAANWEPVATYIHAPINTARVSADGATLLFRSTRRLDDYHNEGMAQFYRYQLGDTAPSCISCNPTGAPPVGSPTLQSIKTELAVTEPAGTPAILTRNLSADGNRVFFEATDKLVAADTNGEEGCPVTGSGGTPSCRDVYEWEAEGSGSCQSSAQNGGCLYLLSTGTSSEPAYFADASASGDDAFIFTRDSLVRQDQDGQVQDIYDISVAGGLASQNQPPRPICEAEGCKPNPSTPPPVQSPVTPGFQGPGDPPPVRKPKPHCPKGKRKVQRHGKSRCVSKGHKSGDHKRRAQSPTGSETR